MNEKLAQCGPGVLRTIRCIVCPTGCEIQVKDVNGEITFEGYTCERGLNYAKEEFTAPKRLLTSTMKVENGFLSMIPVRSDKTILKAQLKQAVKELSKVKLRAPIKMGEVLIKNILGSNANIIASRDIDELHS